jgi:hypothetical protein
MGGFHHWYDVTVGGLIGTGCTFVAFRQTFASIWGFRFNRVLLPPTTPLFLRRPAEDAGALTLGYGLGESEQWPVTREGGWGDLEEVTKGARFDVFTLAVASTSGSMSGNGRTSRIEGNETIILTL